MKQNSKRRVARFLGIMALAACAGGVVGFFGAMHADSFSGVLAAVGTALGYAAPALAALAICICCPLAFRAYRKALRLSCSGQDDEAQPFEDVVDAAGDEPVGHVMGDVGRLGPVAHIDAGKRFAGVGRVFAVGHVCSDQ